MTLPSSPATTLTRLQAWYAAHTDGVWEHSYGVEISTLDNPGWAVRLDLAGTSHEHAAFPEVRHSDEDASAWYGCRKVGVVLEGHCGPEQLEVVLSCMLDWLEAPPS